MGAALGVGCAVGGASYAEVYNITAMVQHIGYRMLLNMPENQKCNIVESNVGSETDEHVDRYVYGSLRTRVVPK